MTLRTRKTTIAIKDEVTYGTDSVPAGANVMQVIDLEVTPISSDVVSRNLIRPWFGNSEQLIANSKVMCTFSVELAGSGTAGTAPRYGPALKSCGMSETVSAGVSVTYAPVSTAFSSATIYFHRGAAATTSGVLHKLTGARGTVTLSCALNQIPRLNFEFMGIYNAPTDATAITPTFANQATPLVFRDGNTSAFQLLSYAGCLDSVEFALNNQMVYRDLIGCAKEVLITDRQPSGTVGIEAVLIATKDYFSSALADGTTGNLTFLHGTTAGNRVTFTAPTIDIGAPAYADKDGVVMLNIPYQAIPSSTGNNEFSLAYT